MPNITMIIMTDTTWAESKKLRPISDVKQAWDTARDSVLNASLLLGTTIALPA